MTVTADEKGCILLPDVKAGDQFEVALSSSGGITLTKVPASRAAGDIRIVRKNGYSVGVLGRPIDLNAIQEALRDVP